MDKLKNKRNQDSELAHRVSSTKRLEDEQHRFHSRLLESIDDAIIVTDIHGRIRYWNPSAERLYGWEASEVTGKSITEVTPTNVNKAKASRIMETLMRGEKWSGEFEAIHRSGRIFTARVINSPVFNDHGQLEAIVGISYDITQEIKLLEELREARQAAERANATKSVFLANMSHEMRTPLTAILGFAGLLSDHGSEATNHSDHKEYIHTIVNAGQHLLGIINNLLDLSKIESGKLDYDPCDTNLKHFVEDAHALLRPLATAKGIELQLRFIRPLPELIHCDALRWRQIIVNIVGNAIKFTDSGSVKVDVYLGQADADDMVVIDVVDTGIGMTPEQSSKIFDDFYQADASIHRNYGGTGLGLSISRKLASLMYGRLSLEKTAINVGSTFRIEMPISAIAKSLGIREKMMPPGRVHESTRIDEYLAHHPHRIDIVSKCVSQETSLHTTAPKQTLSHEQHDPASKNTPQKPIAPNRPRLSGKRILLAEDGLDNQKLIAIYLRKAGAEVDVVENGIVAMRTLEKGQFDYDLVLTDIEMPEMNGYELASTLREKGFQKPIIATTAYVLEADRKKCIESGCDAHVSKPIDREHLISTLSHWIFAAEPHSVPW